MSSWAQRVHRRAADLGSVVTSCGHPGPGPYPYRLEKVKFGVPLDEVCKNDIPGPLLVLILKLNKEAPLRKDVFRAPGHQGAMKNLIHFLQAGRLVNVDNYSVYTIASVLKKFLRKIPNGIFGREGEAELFAIVDVDDELEQQERIHRLITSLPIYTQRLLVLLFGTFRVIASNADRACTGMSSEALGVSVAPSFFQSCVSDGKTARMEDVLRFKVATRIMKKMIDHFATYDLFGRENYEYYARVTGRILKVQDEWICSFRFPPPPRGKLAQQNYALQLSLEAEKTWLQCECERWGLIAQEESQSTPALLTSSSSAIGNSALSLGIIPELSLLESCARLSVSLEGPGLFSSGSGDNISQTSQQNQQQQIAATAVALAAAAAAVKQQQHSKSSLEQPPKRSSLNGNNNSSKTSTTAAAAAAVAAVAAASTTLGSIGGAGGGGGGGGSNSGIKHSSSCSSTRSSKSASAAGSHHHMTMDELRVVNRYAESTKSLSYLPQFNFDTTTTTTTTNTSTSTLKQSSSCSLLSTSSTSQSPHSSHSSHPSLLNSNNHHEQQNIDKSMTTNTTANNKSTHDIKYEKIDSIASESPSPTCETLNALQISVNSLKSSKSHSSSATSSTTSSLLSISPNLLLTSSSSLGQNTLSSSPLQTQSSSCINSNICSINDIKPKQSMQQKNAKIIDESINLSFSYALSSPSQQLHQFASSCALPNLPSFPISIPNSVPLPDPYPDSQFASSTLPADSDSPFCLFATKSESKSPDVINFLDPIQKVHERQRARMRTRSEWFLESSRLGSTLSDAYPQFFGGSTNDVQEHHEHLTNNAMLLMLHHHAQQQQQQNQHHPKQRHHKQLQYQNQQYLQVHHPQRMDISSGDEQDSISTGGESGLLSGDLDGRDDLISNSGNNVSATATTGGYYTAGGNLMMPMDTNFPPISVGNIGLSASAESVHVKRPSRRYTRHHPHRSSSRRNKENGGKSTITSGGGSNCCCTNTACNHNDNMDGPYSASDAAGTAGVSGGGVQQQRSNSFRQKKANKARAVSFDATTAAAAAASLLPHPKVSLTPASRTCSSSSGSALGICGSGRGSIDEETVILMDTTEPFLLNAHLQKQAEQHHRQPAFLLDQTGKTELKILLNVGNSPIRASSVSPNNNTPLVTTTINNSDNITTTTDGCCNLQQQFHKISNEKIILGNNINIVSTAAAATQPLTSSTFASSTISSADSMVVVTQACSFSTDGTTTNIPTTFNSTSCMGIIKQPTDDNNMTTTTANTTSTTKQTSNLHFRPPRV